MDIWTVVGIVTPVLLMFTSFIFWLGGHLKEMKITFREWILHHDDIHDLLREDIKEVSTNVKGVATNLGQCEIKLNDTRERMAGVEGKLNSNSHRGEEM